MVNTIEEEMNKDDELTAQNVRQILVRLECFNSDRKATV